MHTFTLRNGGQMGLGRGLLLVTQALLCLLLSGGCEPSDTVRVTSTVDGRHGSLRDAIKRANHARSAVTVQIPPGTYELTRCGADDDNRNGDLDLETSQTVTLAGTADGVLIRQTCAGERVLDALEDGLLVLKNVTLTGGSVTSDDADVPALGGGVRAEGSVHLDHATVLENSATGAPGVGAIANAPAVDGGAAYGGGLYVRGALSATDSVLSKNSALGGSGAPSSTIDGQAAGGGAAEGGGAYVFGAVVINGGSASDNRAIGAIGGSGPRRASGGLARGGAIAQRIPSAAEVTLIGCTLSGNRAQGGGYGGVLAPGGAPEEPPLSGGDGEGGAVAAAGPLTAKDVTALRNTAASGTSETSCSAFGPTNECIPGVARGGALATAAVASIHAGRFEENRAASGNTLFVCVGSFPSCGGVPAAPALGGAVWTGLSLALYDATFSRNTAQQGTGAANIDGLAQGGAAASDGELVVEGGSYAENTSMRGRGGALSGSAVSVRNATFTGNKADGRGGAILALARLVAEGVTASENRAGGGGGGAIAVIGEARITGSSIRQNIVDSRQGPGGLTVFAGGGGIAVTGHLTITETQVIGNTGRAGLYAGTFCSGCPLTFAGGGIHAGSVEGNRVTIAGNTAVGITGLPSAPPPFGPRVSGGGGIAATGAVVLVNATLSANAVSASTRFDSYSGPAQGAAVLAPSLALDHATIADNANAPSLQVTELTTHRSVAIAAPGQTVCGAGVTVAASSYNAFSDTSCGLSAPTDRQGDAAFVLGPLLDNGGPVPTRLPAAGSVLVDRIPAGSCAEPVDARLVTRPQGAACDIGAVERTPVPGAGPTNFTLSFTNPPAVAVPGQDGVWEITLTNAGNAASFPAVQIDVPAGVAVTSAAATNGGACSTAAPVVCVWNTPFAPGATATITLDAQVSTAVVSKLVWHAEVVAPELQPPLGDDQAELTTPLAPQTGIVVDISSSSLSGQVMRLDVYLSNAGPANVVGTAEQPIEVLLIPAPGVQVTPETDTRIIGSFAPNDVQGVGWVVFNLSFTGPIPVDLGRIEVRTGIVPQPPVPSIPLVRTDLGVRASRPAGAQPEGAPTPLRFEVTNHGPGVARNVNVQLGFNVGTISWASVEGTVTALDETSFAWRLASLAPGQTVTLQGTASGTDSSSEVTVQVRSRAVDFLPENDGVVMNIGPAPNGTADLQVESLEALPSPAPGQSRFRVTVLNAGPAAAPPGDDVPLTVNVFGGNTGTVSSVETADPRFTCALSFPVSWASCSTTQPLAPGARFSFEFVVEGDLSGFGSRPFVTVLPVFGVPDSNPQNNTRFVPATL